MSVIPQSDSYFNAFYSSVGRWIYLLSLTIAECIWRRASVIYKLERSVPAVGSDNRSFRFDYEYEYEIRQAKRMLYAYAIQY